MQHYSGEARSRLSADSLNAVVTVTIGRHKAGQRIGAAITIQQNSGAETCGNLWIECVARGADGRLRLAIARRGLCAGDDRASSAAPSSERRNPGRQRPDHDHRRLVGNHVARRHRFVGRVQRVSGLRSGGPVHRCTVASRPRATRPSPTSSFRSVRRTTCRSTSPPSRARTSSSPPRRSSVRRHHQRRPADDVDCGRHFAKVASVNRDIRDIERRSPFATIDLGEQPCRVVRRRQPALQPLHHRRRPGRRHLRPQSRRQPDAARPGAVRRDRRRSRSRSRRSISASRTSRAASSTSR